MNKIIVMLIGLLLVGCSSNNLSKLDNKSVINNKNDLIKTQNQICNSFKSEDTKVMYSCGSGVSNSCLHPPEPCAQSSR